MVMILICRKDLRSVDRATLTQGILGSGGGGGPEELNLHKPLCEDTSWHFGWKILQEGREESEVEDAQLPSDQRPPTAASVRPSVRRPSTLAAFDLRAFGGVGKSVRACETLSRVPRLSSIEL